MTWRSLLKSRAAYIVGAGFALLLQSAAAFGYSAAPPQLPPVCDSKPDGTRLNLAISAILPEWPSSAIETISVICKNGVPNGPATFNLSGPLSDHDEMVFLLDLSAYLHFATRLIPPATRRIEFERYLGFYPDGPVTGFDGSGRETFRVNATQHGVYGPFEVIDRERGIVTRGSYGYALMPQSWKRGSDRDPVFDMRGLHGLIEQFNPTGGLLFRGYYCYSLPVGLHARFDGKDRLVGVDDFTDSRYGWLPREEGREVLPPGVKAWEEDPVFGEPSVPEVIGTVFRKSRLPNGIVDSIAINLWPEAAPVPDDQNEWSDVPLAYTVDDWFTPGKAIRLPADGEREAATLRVPDSFDWMRPLVPPFGRDPAEFFEEPSIGMVSQCAGILTAAYDLPRSMGLPKWFWYQPHKKAGQ